MAKETKTLEKSMEQLQEILAKLEDEEIGLEASFQLYQEGMKLLKSCNAAVDKVEKKYYNCNFIAFFCLFYCR